jgi:quinol monooxygenase YgiN
MIRIVFTYEVRKEKQDEYLKVTADQIKPFWESHGCDAYTLWQSLWQSPEESTTFVKEMVFKDEPTMQRTMSLEDGQPIKKLFSQFATGVTRATYRQVV